MDNSKVEITFIVGKTGSGKSTIVNELRDMPDVDVLVSYTSRERDISEKEGIDYFFRDREFFETGEWIELVDNYGQFYGIKKDQVEEGKSYVMIANMLGYYKYRKKGFKCKLVYLELEKYERIRRISKDLASGSKRRDKRIDRIIAGEDKYYKGVEEIEDRLILYPGKYNPEVLADKVKEYIGE